MLAPTLSLRDGNAAGAHFVPQLMRTTREMLQCDALTPLLLALRLVSVALLWEPRSYALLRRQDVSTLAPLADDLSRWAASLTTAGLRCSSIRRAGDTSGLAPAGVCGLRPVV